MCTFSKERIYGFNSRVVAPQGRRNVRKKCHIWYITRTRLSLSNLADEMAVVDIINGT